MSVQTISVSPNEKGTAIVTLTATDEDGNSLTIDQLTDPCWQLMKTDGTVINNRSFANCPLTSLTFVLYGDDLAIFKSKNAGGTRVLSFKASYDSDAGSGLPLIAECTFDIAKILGQTDET